MSAPDAEPDLRLRLDLRASAAPLPAHFFLRFSFLVELDVSGRPDIAWLPPSISQCALLRRVDISRTAIARPPPVLFAIPALRAEPARIRFGDGERCTAALARAVLRECRAAPMAAITLQDPAGGSRRIAFPSDLRPADVVSLAFPHLRPLIPYLFLVRTCGAAQLRITNPHVPLALYALPGAEWSLKLRYLPPIRLESTNPLVLNFVKELSISYKELEKRIGDAVDHLLLKPLLTARRCTVRPLKTPAARSRPPIVIAATNEWAAITCGEASYYVFPTADLALDLNAADIPVLVCGQNAIPLEQLGDPEKMLALLPVFALAAGEFVNGEAVEPERRPFEALVAESVPAFVSGTNPRMVPAPLDSTRTLDEQLAELRKVRGTTAVFRRV
jgi:hypothetical protein